MVNVLKNDTVCVEAEILKDVLWYIQGAIDQSRLEINSCSFNSDHIKALQTAIEVLNEQANEIDLYWSV